MRKGTASSDTDESGVSASFARIARRVGSASAWNVASRAAAPEWLTIWLTIMRWSGDVKRGYSQRVAHRKGRPPAPSAVSGARLEEKRRRAVYGVTESNSSGLDRGKRHGRLNVFCRNAAICCRVIALFGQ